MARRTSAATRPNWFGGIERDVLPATMGANLALAHLRSQARSPRGP
jgi:hypothetical protein